MDIKDEETVFHPFDSNKDTPKDEPEYENENKDEIFSDSELNNIPGLVDVDVSKKPKNKLNNHLVHWEEKITNKKIVQFIKKVCALTKTKEELVINIKENVVIRDMNDISSTINAHAESALLRLIGSDDLSSRNNFDSIQNYIVFVNSNDIRVRTLFAEITTYCIIDTNFLIQSRYLVGRVAQMNQSNLGMSILTLKKNYRWNKSKQDFDNISKYNNGQVNSSSSFFLSFDKDKSGTKIPNNRDN